MKQLIFGIILTVLINSILADELYIHISSKNSKTIILLLRRLFPVDDVTKERISVRKVNTIIEFKKAEAPVSLNHHRSIQCNVCVQVVKMYEQAFNRSLSPATIQKTFTGMCDIFKAPYRSGCIKFYNTTGLQAIKDILHGVPPQKICSNLKYCTRNIEDVDADVHMYTIPLILFDRYIGDERCRFCVNIVRFYEQIVDSTKSLTFVVKRLSAICSVYQARYQTGCSNYFRDPHVLQFYQSILAHKDPYKTCQNASMCHKIKTDLRLPDVKLPTYPPRSLSCRICYGHVFIFEAAFNRSKSFGKLKKIFTATCDVLKAHIRYVCITFYNTTGQKTLKDILDSVDPWQVCTNMHLCQPRKTVSKLQRFVEDFFLRFIYVSKYRGKCSDCQGQARYLEMLLDPSKSVTFLLEKLSAICDLYTSPYQPYCRHSLEKSETIHYFKSILAHVSPLKICEKSKMCPAKENRGQLKENLLLDHTLYSLPCRLCFGQVFMYEIVFNRSVSPSKFQDVLNDTCQLLKPTNRTMCIKFYKEKGLATIKDILHSVDPWNICKTMHICGHDDDNVKFLRVVKGIFFLLHDVTKGNGTCDECQARAKYLEDVLDPSKAVTFVLQKLSVVCSVYSKPYQADCFSYLKLPAVVQYFKSVLAHVDPLKICQATGQCPKKEISLDDTLFFLPRTNIL